MGCIFGAEMSGMFDDAVSFNQPIGDWNTSSVKYMSYTFTKAASFNQSLADWDVSSVKKMVGMFDRASSFNQPLGNWDVSNVENMKWVFSEARAFNQDISDWNVSSVSDFYDMFENSNALSETNRGKIHESFSSNPNWPYDWGPDEPEPESYELALRGNLVMENLPAGTVVGSLEVIAESGGDATTDFDFELIGIDGNPLSAGEGGPSPVNGITSLTFERSQWITLSDISLELPDGREPGKKYLWPNQAFTYDQHYSMDIGRDDATKAKVNDNMAGEPVGLFETWAEIKGGSLSTLGGWAITDIVVSGNKVEKFTVSHGSGGSGMGEGPAFTLTADGLLQTARVLDHEEASRHEFGIRATGANGESLEKIFEVKVGDEFRPIVRTVELPNVTLSSHLWGFSNNTQLKQDQDIGYLYVAGENGEPVEEQYVFEALSSNDIFSVSLRECCL